MSAKKTSRNTRSLQNTRRLRRRSLLRIIVPAAGAIALAAVVLALLSGPGKDAAVAPQAGPGTAPADAPVWAQSEMTPAPTVNPTPMITAEPTPAPTPSPAPDPTPTFVPGSLPDVISFYRPQGKNYSPRVRMGESCTAAWKKGKDIGSFEVIASDEEFLDGDFFGDIFGAAWSAFPAADSCKIGYTLQYTLDSGQEIRYTMLSPSHIEHTEYIECWLYDDYHRKPHKSYSHLKPSSMKAGTLMTSIKLTAGREIAHVTDIRLTAFICSSLNDFDEERNYIGPTSCTIHILRK